MYQLPEGEYCMYLRKSRKDLEAEARGEGETLEKHRRNLFELAKRYGISISEIYPEVVTGERISARPEMQRLLEDVEDGRWRGVLVMEVERLARGDTMDQGIVAQTFKFSNTLIVTPMRNYNPNDPNDEEYFEFGLFMSRREFKTITRRLQWGRADAVKEGKFVGNVAPYGYIRKKLQSKGWTMEPHPEQAPIVKMIFDMYTDADPRKRKGTALIARYLNDMKVPTMKNSEWIAATINGILRNPTYTGYVHWGSRPAIKNRDGGFTRPRKSRNEWTMGTGLHPAIVEEETFLRAQEILRGKTHLPAPAGKISNPLAGLIRCQMCDSAMIYRPYKKPDTRPTLICIKQSCSCKSSYFDMVEARLLESLAKWLEAYRAQWGRGKPQVKQKEPMIDAKAKIVAGLQKDLAELKQQKGNLQDLVEKEAYTIEEYLERSQVLSVRIAEKSAALEKATEELEKEQARSQARIEIIPKIEHVLEAYPATDDPAMKNGLLRSVLEMIYYKKENGGRWSGAQDSFELTLFPKLPK